MLQGRLLGRAERLRNLGPPGERERDSERVRVIVATTETGRSLELLATARVQLAPGAAVQVMLRPTAVRICRQGGAAMLRVVVRDGAYHGRGYDYVL